MHKPHPGIISYDAQRRGVHGRQLDGVAPDGVGLSFHNRRVQGRIIGCIVLGALDNLKLVPMQMAEM